MKCAECGAPASEQDLFCGECGAILAPAAGEPAVADELAAADSPADAAAFELPLDSLPPVAPPEPVYGDPAFRDPGGGDYGIGPGSAALDAGEVTAVDVDFEGDRRPIGSGWDIGADEGWQFVFLPLVMRDYGLVSARRLKLTLAVLA